MALSRKFFQIDASYFCCQKQRNGLANTLTLRKCLNDGHNPESRELCLIVSPLYTVPQNGT